MSSEPDVSFTPADAPAPERVPVYGRGHRWAVAACGWFVGLIAGTAAESALGGEPFLSLLGGIAAAVGGWFTAPAVCAKVGIKPAAPPAEGAEHGTLAVVGFIMALVGYVVTAGGLSIAAVVCGHIAHHKAASAGRKKGLAVAAWVIGWVGTVLYLGARAGL